MRVFVVNPVRCQMPNNIYNAIPMLVLALEFGQSAEAPQIRDRLLRFAVLWFWKRGHGKRL